MQVGRCLLVCGCDELFGHMKGSKGAKVRNLFIKNAKYLAGGIVTVMMLGLAADSVRADLLGVTPSFPKIAYDSSGLVFYDGNFDSFIVEASPVAILFTSGGVPRFVNATGVPAGKRLSISIRVDHVTGALIGGDSSGPDLIVTGEVDADGNGSIDYSGVLLTGEVLGFGFADSGGPTDFYDFRFAVTGGALAPLYTGREIGITTTSEHSNFAGFGLFEGTFTGGAKGDTGPIGTSGCALAVQLEGCVIKPPPPVSACTGGAIALTLMYSGPSIAGPTTVQIIGGSSSVSYNLPGLSNGDILSNPSENGFSIDATAHNQTKLGSQTRVIINGVTEILHTSCSCPIPDYNLKVCNPICLDASSPDNTTGSKGPASPLWTLMALKDPSLGIITCGNTTTECITELPTPSPAPNCKGDVRSLQFIYAGGGCAATQHSQDSKNVQCTTYIDNPNASPVRIRVTDGGKKVYLDTGSPANVELGQVLDVPAGPKFDDKFGRDMCVAVYDATDRLMTTVKFKSDCSKPINVGDRFGSVQVTAVNSKDFGLVQLGSDVRYTYTITNTGSTTLTGISVIDDTYGNITGTPIASLAPGGSTNFTIKAFVLKNTTNTVTVTANGGQCAATAQALIIRTPQPCPCDITYPFASANPRTSVIFNESEVLRTYFVTAGNSGQKIRVWYNDEHALVLGVRRISVKTSSGTTVTDFPLTPLPGVPGSTVSPQVGATALTGNLAGVDPVGRPLYPSLFITDITSDPNSLAGDWQFGGAPITPHAVFGVWKGATMLVDATKSPVLRTITTDSNPAKNDPLGDSRLGPGGDIPPQGFAFKYPTVAGDKDFSEGFTAEVVWDVDTLVAQGKMIPGHTYRVQFMVHDGDQNKTGGDVGQACGYVGIGVDPACPPPPPPPPAPYTCTKPISQISMIWNGTQPIRIKAWKGSVGTTLLADIDDIQIGQKVTVAGYSGTANDVIWELFKAGTSTLLGRSDFHLSCSDVDMNSSDDCGKPAGDGKGLSGFINDWIFAGMVGPGGALDCFPDVP